jgi:MraZ protein
MFTAEYDLSIDAKGRFLLPSALRKKLPKGDDAQMVLSKGFEKCLNLYTISEWNKLVEKLEKLNEFNPKVRVLKRLIYHGANTLEIDSAGRLLMSKSLMEHIGVDKEKNEIIMVSTGSKFEIWEQNEYNNHIANAMKDFDGLATEVLGDGFFNPFES